MAESHFDPQISAMTNAFEARRYQSFYPRLLRSEKRDKGCFTKDLRPHNGGPVPGNRESATCTATKEELAAVGAAGRGRIIERADVDTELDRIRESSGVARGEEAKHPTIAAVAHVVSTITDREDELGPRA